MTRTTKICAAAFLAVVGSVLGVTVATASDHRERDGDEHEEHEHRHGERRGRHEDRERGDAREGERGRAAAGPAIGSDPGAAALYRKECGACHLAFPPGMLSADAHRRTLAGLDRHFGQNAELDAPVRDRLERWMVENAGGADGAASLRVTEQPRFRHEHRKIGAAVVARPAVRTLANCAACHTRAQDWDFEDDGVKIPR